MFFSSKIFKHSLTFGVIIASVSFAFFLVLYFLGFTPIGNKKLPDIGFNIILTAAAFWIFKRKNNGYMHTWEGISIGYLTNVISMIITALLIYLFIEFVDTSILKKHIDEMLVLVQKSKAEHIKTFGEPSFNSMLKEIPKTTTSDIFWDEILKKSIFMVIPIFIMAAIFRKIEPKVSE